MYTVRVDYLGGVDEDSIDPARIRARVESSAAPRVTAGRNALAFLIPLACTHDLYLAKGNSQLRELIVSWAELVAAQVLEGEPEARDYARSGGWSSRPAESGHCGSQADPHVEPPERGPVRTWTAILMKGRRRRHGGAIWARTRVSPRGSQPYFAIAGGFELLKWAIRKDSYEQTVVPAAVGISTMARLYRTIGASWDSLGREALALTSQNVKRLVLTRHPLQELEPHRPPVSAEVGFVEEGSPKRIRGDHSTVHPSEALERAGGIRA